jgi:hypothetical protein
MTVAAISATSPQRQLDLFSTASSTAGSNPYALLEDQDGINLTQLAAPVYQALQSTAAFPASSDPAFVVPLGTGVLRLYEAVQAIAAERVYPAPVFSFAA